MIGLSPRRTLKHAGLPATPHPPPTAATALVSSPPPVVLTSLCPTSCPGQTPHLAVVVPVGHCVLPLADLLLHSKEFLLQEMPHGGQVTAIDPVVVNGDCVLLERVSCRLSPEAHSGHCPLPCLEVLPGLLNQEVLLPPPRGCQQGRGNRG